jgi:hypothetical protein
MAQRKFSETLNSFYRSNAEDLMLFAWVQGMQKTNPDVKLKTCVEMFLIYFEISEEELSLNTALRNYHRTLHKFYKNGTTKKSC